VAGLRSCATGSSSESLPFSASRRMAAPVNVLVTPAMRKPAVAVSGSRVARSASPAAPAQVSLGVATASATPGKLWWARTNRRSSWSSWAGSGAAVAVAGAGAACAVKAAASRIAASDNNAVARRV
jgi:hypothetical protein